jgi:hypothetical protein
MHPGDYEFDDRAARRERKRRRLLWFGAAPILVLMLAGAVAPLVTVALDRREERRFQRREQAKWEALFALPYPDAPVPASESRLVKREHRGRLNVFTPFLELESAPAGVQLQVRTSQELAGRVWPEDDIMFKLAGTGHAWLPSASYQTSPLRLGMTAGEFKVRSTEFEATQLSKSMERGQNSVMHFSIPTAVFLEWIQERNPSGQIGGIRFTVPAESRTVLIDFAATLRPVAPP